MTEGELLAEISKRIDNSILDRAHAKRNRRRNDFYIALGYHKAMNEVRDLIRGKLSEMRKT